MHIVVDTISCCTATRRTKERAWSGAILFITTKPLISSIRSDFHLYKVLLFILQDLYYAVEDGLVSTVEVRI